MLLAAVDPANTYGVTLAWPPSMASVAASEQEGVRHLPGRKAGAVVVLIDGALVLFLERGGRSVVTFTDSPLALEAGAHELAAAVRDSRLPAVLSIEQIDGEAPAHTALGVTLAAVGFAATPRGALRLRR